MIDIKKKYKTRSGLDVRLVSDQGHPNANIVGYAGDDTWPSTWNNNGEFRSTVSELIDHQMYDLVEVKENKVMYLLINAYGDLDTSEIADTKDRELYTTRIRVEYKEGQFDD